MRWNDRVYGEVEIDDPEILALIRCPTVQRLRGIRQAGPSAFAFPFKNVTRFEHCLGVYLLLTRLGADRRQRVAGLLHDISHTAFSHAVDFIFHSDEQDYHEKLKPEFLRRPDVAGVLGRMGYEPAEFYDDSIYPILERPLPLLCADRLDYFLRDSLACEVSTPESVARCLAHITVVDDLIAFTDPAVATDAVERFAEMNRRYWAGETESFIYNEFADALREAFRIGALRESDLLRDDSHVLSRLRGSGNARIAQAMEHIEHFRPEMLAGFVAKVSPKVRWLDPPVAVEGRAVRLSELA
ncbi:MAG: superfamily phosphohydrolase [Planctomycetota bacterium]|nr:superfamily phosphohydrolase [Planctomycetota bacterium]